jgi:transcriptional regulator with XRE-family HTH domain
MRRYVGERIKRLRDAQDMTLEEVSRLTGIEAGLLAAYEAGTSVPAIGALIQLSRVFGSKVEGLLHGGGAASESLTICRSRESFGGTQGDTEQSYSYTSLTRPGTAGHLMEPFLLSFDPKVPQGAAITHPGQEFVYIVDGTLELFYDGKCYRLEKGDSAYLDSTRPHTYHGLGDQIAHMLAVVASP